MSKRTSTNGSQDSLRRALRERLAGSQEARFVLRMLCLLLVSAGVDNRTLARSLGKTTRTLERWGERYAKDGIAGLWDRPRQGRMPALTDEEARQIRRDLGRRPADLGYPVDEWTGAVLAEHIRRSHGHALGIRQCQRLLSHWRGQQALPDRPAHAASSMSLKRPADGKPSIAGDADESP